MFPGSVSVLELWPGTINKVVGSALLGVRVVDPESVQKELQASAHFKINIPTVILSKACPAQLALLPSASRRSTGSSPLWLRRIGGLNTTIQVIDLTKDDD